MTGLCGINSGKEFEPSMTSPEVLKLPIAHWLYISQDCFPSSFGKINTLWGKGFGVTCFCGQGLKDTHISSAEKLEVSGSWRSTRRLKSAEHEDASHNWASRWTWHDKQILMLWVKGAFYTEPGVSMEQPPKQEKKSSMMDPRDCCHLSSTVLSSTVASWLAVSYIRNKGRRHVFWCLSVEASRKQVLPTTLCSKHFPSWMTKYQRIAPEIVPHKGHLKRLEASLKVKTSRVNLRVRFSRIGDRINTEKNYTIRLGSKKTCRGIYEVRKVDSMPPVSLSSLTWPVTIAGDQQVETRTLDYQIKKKKVNK